MIKVSAYIHILDCVIFEHPVHYYNTILYYFNTRETIKNRNNYWTLKTILEY